jgi:hypothetical protein
MFLLPETTLLVIEREFSPNLPDTPRRFADRNADQADKAAGAPYPFLR